MDNTEALPSQPLIDHLIELRRRLMISIATFFIASIIC
jgi:Sec-independent protein secretion pathway component TatC